MAVADADGMERSGGDGLLFDESFDELRNLFRMKEGSGGLDVLIAVLRDERLDDLNDLLLLSPWKSGHGFKDLTSLSARSGHPAGGWFSQNVFHRRAQYPGHLDQNR
jgi:hypothetical protein